ncbi:MAG: YfhO family protein [Clostridiales bacterium]|nr:YfhO family protein [Clostridiales bacterium]
MIGILCLPVLLTLTAIEGNHFKKYRKIKNGICLYTILFLLLVIIGYLPLWKNGLSVIWNVDGIGQYYPSFLYIGQYLRNFLSGLMHGKLILPVWDLSIGMGEDITGVLNYYGFGDPINLLSVFAVSKNGAYIFTICFFLRLWLAGYTFQLYCQEIHISRTAAVLSSFCYAFCGFAVYGGGRYIEWLSVLIYFPLLLSGAEKIIKGEKRSARVLILATAYGALCGFYFLYMSCLCLGVYCCVRLTAVNGLRSVKKNLQKCVCLLWNFFLGLFLAAPVFLPAVSAYFNSERSTQGSSVMDILFHAENYIPCLNTSLISVIFQFFHDQKQNLSGILLLELIALALLFLIHSRKALQLKIAVLIALAALHLPITGWLFNGFGETNDRWCFCIHFLAAVILSYVLTILSDTEIKITKKDVNYIGRKTMTIVLYAFTACNIIVNLWLLYSGRSYSSNWKSEMIACEAAENYTSSPVNCSDIITEDDSLFRISNDSLTNINGRPETVAMINDYYGTTWWFSIINSNTQAYADMVAQKSLNWRSYGFYNNLIYEAFAGVKYYLSNNTETVSDEYVFLEEIEFNGDTWSVYENPYYFGMAYTRNEKEAEAIFREEETYEDYYRELYALYIDGQENIDVSYSRSENTFSCTVASEEDDELVLFIPYSKNWKAYVDDKEVETEKTDMMYISVSLEEGEHSIVLKYDPTEMKIGFLLFLLGIVLCFIQTKNGLHKSRSAR